MEIFPRETYKKLVQPDGFSPAEMEAIYRAHGFDNVEMAHSALQRIAVHPAVADWIDSFVPALFLGLEKTASPNRALLNLERFIDQSRDATMLKSLMSQPRLLEMLLTLFTGSQFLSDILLRHPEYLHDLSDVRQLAVIKSTEKLVTEGNAFLQTDSAGLDSVDLLRRFQRKELLRIGMGDLLSIIDFRAVIRQLSNLADAIIQICLKLSLSDLPPEAHHFAVLGMGKLGGRELNYSSDIDLVFVSQSGEDVTQQLGRKLIDLLTRPTAEGFLYRVDMRLRPWGNAGRLTPALAEYLEYLKTHAQSWEKQALLKSRFIAGDEAIGQAFTRQSRPLIFLRKAPDDQRTDAVRSEVHGMKQKIEQKLKRHGGEFGEVKSGIGSIRDVEFTTQYLQLIYGDEYPQILTRSTLDALARMAAANILPARNFRVLTDGYTFLRSIEHYLQMMHNQQTHQLPEDERELQFLARRLGFEGKNSGTQLVNRYRQHRQAIREIYRRYLDAGYAGQMQRSQTTQQPVSIPSALSLDAVYNTLFSQIEITQHQQMAAELSPEQPVKIHTLQLDENRWQLTVVGYDYLGVLSVICGLLFVQHFNIVEGHIFTYDAPDKSKPGVYRRRRLPMSQLQNLRKKTVAVPGRRVLDVLTVQRNEPALAETWDNYQQRLTQFWELLRDQRRDEARGKLARLFAKALPESAAAQTLLPVDIEIDNTASPDFTVLRIDAPDTIGFLYELTNALALNGIDLIRVEIRSVGNRAHDTLFVTDVRGNKITDPQKQRRLRAATVLVKQFTHLLPQSPNPAAAMLHFQQFVSQVFSQPESYVELATLERPEVLDALARLLGVSDFLWEDFLRMQHANLFPVLQNLELLKEAATPEELRNDLKSALETAADTTTRRQILNAFKDREMFRIDMRYIQGFTGSFWDFSEELSDLVEIVIRQAVEIALPELEAQHGVPRTATGARCPLCVCALGKFGGREMGFASDVELMFLFSETGSTDGEKSLTNTEYFEKLVVTIAQLIEARKEGIFELDLRLRPYGKAGRMAVLLSAFAEYFAPEGPAWNYERQSLVRLRPIFGDDALAKKIVALRDQFLYESAAFDAAAMRAIREKQVRQLVAGGTVNAKFSPGALVELEYLVQGLQILHGKNHPELRQTNTRKALAALENCGIISKKDHAGLMDAHLFLRRLIEAQRMVRGNAKDLTIPPEDSDEFNFLAKRLNYGDDIDRLHEDMLTHTAFIQKISKKLLR